MRRPWMTSSQSFRFFVLPHFLIANHTVTSTSFSAVARQRARFQSQTVRVVVPDFLYVYGNFIADISLLSESILSSISADTKWKWIMRKLFIMSIKIKSSLKLKSRGLLHGSLADGINDESPTPLRASSVLLQTRSIRQRARFHFILHRVG